MRTRFLNVDYFSSSSSIETASFLNLPVPHLHSQFLSGFDEDRLRFDSLLPISLEIERFPIDAALSKFVSEVIPHSIDADFRDLEESPSPSGQDLLDELDKCSSRSASQRVFEKGARSDSEVKEVESQRGSVSEVLEKDDDTEVDKKDTPRFEAIVFEIPELDSCLDKACFSEKEIEAFSEVPEVELDLDMLQTGLEVQYYNKIRGSVHSVEYVALDYNMKENAYIVEDENFVGKQALSPHGTFPTLEVDELALQTLTSQSLEDAFLTAVKHLESQLSTEEDDRPINSKELLGSIDYDLLKLLSDGCLSKQIPEQELAFPVYLTDLDLVSLVQPQVELNSRLGSSDDCFWYVNSVTFEECLLFDSNSSRPFEPFLHKQTTQESEICNWQFAEDMGIKSFNELIVSPELAHVDDTFKSLPVPILSEHKEVNSFCSFAEELLSGLKLLPLSTSDAIYLDWHILEVDKCKSEVQSAFQNMVEKIDLNGLDYDLEVCEDMNLVSDFIFSDNGLNKSTIEKYDEALDMQTKGISFPNGDNVVDLSVDMLGSQCSEPRSGENQAEKDAKRTSLLSKALPQFNDLNFFLNPQKAGAAEDVEYADEELGLNAALPKVLCNDSAAVCASNSAQLQQWNIRVYDIKTSDSIVALIDCFTKSYLDILQNETELNSFLPEDNFVLLSLPKQKLMECIKKKIKRRSASSGEEDIMAFATLCAIKQMAWYLCFYGIQITNLYLDKLCRSLESLKSRLCLLQSVIQDAYEKADREITRSHLSLSVIWEILQPKTSQGNLKVLILSDQVFWCCLKKLLVSLGLTCNEQQNLSTNVNLLHETTNIQTDIQLTSDCLLLSFECVSASFPFNKFNLILEYGGPRDSSRIASFPPNLVGLPDLHFLKVELQEFSASKALCEGVDMAQATKLAVEGESHSNLDSDENTSHQKLLELLNFVPIEGNCHTTSAGAVANVKAQSIPPSVSRFPTEEKTNQTEQRMLDTVIVVNTQNFDKEMIVSRRSTYQKILALEKEGVQLLERDSDLPVDVIISSAISIVWYDSRNIGKKATAMDEASSSLPLCIENIAANVLTLLSFTFSGCFLVFEGEIGFLSTVMESSAGLYAAAASLGIDFQLFCSYSSELTDEIILNCIKYAAILTKNQLPKMPESETLAESFLTRFPSINPLTAHAILSSGRLLIEFLEWSYECRVRAMQNYCVPDESIALFSTLCKYGEREDAKSILTDSSSVSSGLDSAKCLVNVNSQSKRRKYDSCPQNVDFTMDDFKQFDPMDLQSGDFLVSPRLPKGTQPWISKDPGVFQGHDKPRPCLTNMFGRQQEFDFTAMENPQLLNGTSIHDLAPGGKYNIELDMAAMNNLDFGDMDDSNIWSEDFKSKVIYINDSPLGGEGLSYIARSKNISSSVPEMEKDPARKSKIVRKLSFDNSSRMSLPTSREMNSDSDVLTSSRYPRQSFQGTQGSPDREYNINKLPLKNQENFLDEALARGSPSCRGSLLRKGLSSPCGTPFSKAICSPPSNPGSPWTIEFLNRIREKIRLRRQSLPPDMSPSDYDILGRTSKVHKRKNPSILDFFKYQGGNTPLRKQEEKKRRLYQQPLRSFEEKKPSPSLLPKVTPIAQRGRQGLSFALDGSGSQTKLVWKRFGNK